MRSVLIAVLLAALALGTGQDAKPWVEVSYDGVTRGALLPTSEPCFDGPFVGVSVLDANEGPVVGDSLISAFEIHAWEECDAIRILVFARLPANSDPGTVHDNPLNRRRLVATTKLQGSYGDSEIPLTDVRRARTLAVRLTEK